jgi:signal peptidase I
MGDHRSASKDSRYWGLVPRELIKGRALLVWWSYEETADDSDRKGLDTLKAMASKATHFLTRSRFRRCFSLIR